LAVLSAFRPTTIGCRAKPVVVATFIFVQKPRGGHERAASVRPDRSLCGQACRPSARSDGARGRKELA